MLSEITDIRIRIINQQPLCYRFLLRLDFDAAAPIARLSPMDRVRLLTANDVVEAKSISAMKRARRR